MKEKNGLTLTPIERIIEQFDIILIHGDSTSDSDGSFEDYLIRA